MYSFGRVICVNNEQNFLFSFQNKMGPHYLMFLMATFSILGSLVVILLPESMPHEAMKRDSNASKHTGDDQQEER